MGPSRLSAPGFSAPVRWVFYDMGMAHDALGATASQDVRFSLPRREMSWRGRRRLVSSLSGMHCN
jgi:hypothetical protein